MIKELYAEILAINEHLYDTCNSIEKHIHKRMPEHTAEWHRVDHYYSAQANNMYENMRASIEEEGLNEQRIRSAV